jgi:hypothetical protein
MVGSLLLDDVAGLGATLQFLAARGAEITATIALTALHPKTGDCPAR